MHTPLKLLISLLLTLTLASTLLAAEDSLEDAQRSFTRGDYDMAEDLLQTETAAADPNPEAWALSARVALARGKLPEAQAAFEKALQLTPDNLVWHYELGKIFNNLGQHSAAITHFARVLEAAQDHREAQRGLIDSLAYLGRFQEAQIGLKDLIKDNDQNWLDRYSLAALLMQDGKFVSAKQELEAIQAEVPSHFRIRLDLCALYFQLGESAKCKDLILDYGPDEIENIDFCILRAAYHMKQRQFKKAQAWIDRALELAPDAASFISLKYVNETQLGKIVLDEARKPEDGVKSFLQEHYRKAAKMLNYGNIEQAQKKITWLMRYYPDDPDLKLMNAMCEGEKGHLDEAVEQLRAITKLNIPQISVIDASQDMLKEYVRQREYEQRVVADEWARAEESDSNYFHIKMNVAAPYREQILEQADKYVTDILTILEKALGERPAVEQKAKLNIYADKYSFRAEAYDYYFSDAMLFHGVYTSDTKSIYYHLNKDLEVAGIVHEIAHFVLNETLTNTPAWLNEGFAEYVSLRLSGVHFLDREILGKNYFKQLYRFYNLPTVDVLVKKRDYEIESYLLWRGLVQFFFEFNEGQYLPGLKRYINLLSNDSFKQDAFREAFAEELPQLEIDWQEFAGRRLVI